MDNWLVIICGVIFLIGLLIGGLRGFLKLGVSLIATVATIAIMIFLTPIIGNVLQERTPLGSAIEERAIEAFMPELTFEDMQNFDLTGTPLEGLSEEEWEQVSEFEMQRAGITEEVLLQQMGELPRSAQMQILEQAPIPKFIRDKLIENNNSVIYDLLGANTFPEYVASMLARMTIYLVSFLISFVLAFIIVQALIVAVDIIGELPVTGTINRLGGAAVGGGFAVILIWILFLVISLMYTSNIGLSLFEQIESNEILTYLFENNIIKNRLLEF